MRRRPPQPRDERRSNPRDPHRLNPQPRDAHTVRDTRAGLRDEHLIFVKNVPNSISSSIPTLFAPYSPLRVKNVYPHSDITTIVLGFRTQAAASIAQQETDGMRWENVVLRVEGYSKMRSVRYVREERGRGRPRGAVGGEEAGQEWEEVYEDEDGQQSGPELEYETVFPDVAPAVKRDVGGATTWAQVAKQTRRLSRTHAADRLVAESSRLDAVVDEHLDEAVPSPMKAGPRAPTPSDWEASQHEEDDADERWSNTATPGAIHSHSPTASSSDFAGYAGDIEDNRKTTKVSNVPEAAPAAPTSLFAPWEPIDTSERILLLHCRDCLFCQKRNCSRN
ncbi:hypothetical protein EK21DRAFT_91789 [Setomelanomma holmii]|uniref:Uncharacterized protein n=1 Tax=Setomelanomma holmii TaxID=210430 RepID=A0A9P4LKK6_9PLEO|nr:hypothetical protein EK21DRAFT_91789 [Setomelanomma holmii]